MGPALKLPRSVRPLTRVVDRAEFCRSSTAPNDDWPVAGDEHSIHLAQT